MAPKCQSPLLSSNHNAVYPVDSVVYYELLNPNKIITEDRYKQQLLNFDENLHRITRRLDRLQGPRVLLALHRPVARKMGKSHSKYLVESDK